MVAFVLTLVLAMAKHATARPLWRLVLYQSARAKAKEGRISPPWRRRKFPRPIRLILPTLLLAFTLRAWVEELITDPVSFYYLIWSYWLYLCGRWWLAEWKGEGLKLRTLYALRGLGGKPWRGYR